MRKKVPGKALLIAVSMIAVALVSVASLAFFQEGHGPEAEPEEWHMIGDGVYLNVYTDDSRGQVADGIFENVTEDTVFYASIQNSGQERQVRLACYLNYERIPVEILDDSYDEQILIQDKANITIPFRLKGEILPDTNYKLLVSLFLGTDLHESDTEYQTTQHTLSYDYYLKNSESSGPDLQLAADHSTKYLDYDFPSFVLNTDFSSDSDGVRLPPSELKAAPGESFELAYRIGKIDDACRQLMIVTIDYQQANINGERSLLIETEEGRTSFGTITLRAPEVSGKYEICALVVPDPEEANAFTLLENAYRFTLTVE